MKIAEVIERAGHWDDQQQRWVGTRHTGYLPDHVQLGTLSFEQHLARLVPQQQHEIEQRIKSPRLRQIITMALNGYTAEMIADELYDLSNDDDFSKLAKASASINVQLNQTRRKYNIPIPKASLVSVNSALSLALEIKHKWYNTRGPRYNSDLAVGKYLHAQGLVPTPDVVSVKLSQYRKSLAAKGQEIPDWLKPKIKRS